MQNQSHWKGILEPFNLASSESEIDDVWWEKKRENSSVIKLQLQTAQPLELMKDGALTFS